MTAKSRVLNQRGFTLVEIMIVVALMGLLAALAIPNFLRARMTANEGAIQLDLRTFSSANEAFRSAQNPPQYANGIGTLTGAVPAYLDIGWNLAAGQAKHGYTFAYAGGGIGNPNTFSIVAGPQQVGVTANNSFCVDQAGSLIGPAPGGGQPGGNALGCIGGSPMVG